MKNKGKRRKKKLDFKIVLLSGCVLYFVVTATMQQISLGKISGDIKKIESQIDVKEKELEKLDNSKDYYSSDEYIEEAAREKLGMVRADETVFIDITGK